MTRDVSSPETALRVHSLLRSLADENGFVSAAYRDIASELSIGRTTADNAVRRLVRDGGLEIARPGTGCLYPTTYRVNGWPEVDA